MNNQEAIAFLKNYTLADGGKDLLPCHMLEGFLFAVCTFPDLIQPSEWLPMVWGEKPPFKDMDDCQQYLNAVMTIYNSINDAVRFDKVPAAKTAALKKEPMANFERGCPIQQWSEGVLLGDDWLADAFDDLHAELCEEYGDQYAEVFADRIVSSLSLTLFVDENASREHLHEFSEEESFEDYVNYIASNFESQMKMYASFRKNLENIIRDVGPSAKSLPGRNDPCPCGSGVKYKKCCGITHGRN